MGTCMHAVEGTAHNADIGPKFSEQGVLFVVPTYVLAIAADLPKVRSRAYVTDAYLAIFGAYFA